MLDLTGLSPVQRAVVLAPDGPLAVIAGPGSGKTTVLAARVAYLVEARRVSPTTVLALTFTAAAARTLHTRLTGLLGVRGRDVDVATFHRFGLRIVRQWSAELGLGPGPIAVYTDADARLLLREVVSTLGMALDRAALAEVARRLERRRLAGSGAEGNAELDHLAEAYEALLARRGAVDFPGMLTLPLRLFATHPPALRLVQDAYRAVLCDEAQDICVTQYRLLRLLAARHHHLTLVGDPRQTLYDWRGADSRFLRNFSRDFPGARELRLDQNFRSTGRIVEVANALGAALGETRPLWTENSPGPSPVLYVATDEQDEARFVAAEITRLLGAGAIDQPDEVAVLYRTNDQAGELTVALHARRLPYSVRGSGDLFARREVRDTLAYLRLAHDPTDAAALARVVNVPPRKLGRVAAALRTQPVGLPELPTLAHRFGPTAVANAEALVTLVEDLRAQSADRPPGELLELVLDHTGYRVWLASRADGPSRRESLARLRRIVGAGGEAGVSDLGGWLADLGLEGTDDVDLVPEKAVLLSTIHQAKGDEARVVFVVGCEEGLLPHARALRDNTGEDGIAAECQAAYVAVTRARERLYLTYCRRRRRGERHEVRQPSRFLRGLPLDPGERAA